MCPYARFQSAMFDRDTLVISYDTQRGEPRGGRKRSVDRQTEGLGDCIDCQLCVQVCPTGIDIRDGLQYECIACAACVDACNSIMDKMDYPRGLVRYTTQHALEGNESRILRPRTFVYAALLTVLLGGLIVSMVTRTPLILDVIRDRNTLFRELPRGMIENTFTLKVINQSDDERKFQLHVAGVEGIHLDGVDNPVTVEGGGVSSLPVRVRAHRDDAYGIITITFSATATDDPSIVVEEDSRFLGPTP
jgi:cytochrome c oxidase accessory protein FixG